jgi:Flp pilus assembly protein TadG
MKQERYRGTDIRNESGIAILYVAASLVLMGICAGLSIDLGSGYVLKAQLSKAVDGAALAAARALGSGAPQAEAARIFKANIPANFMGATSITDPDTDPNFFDMRYDSVSGSHIITVNATAVLPTGFMRLLNQNQLTVVATGEATRRLVDLVLVLDTSSSLGAGWADVRDASRAFVNSFSTSDRLSLVLYSDGARVPVQIPADRSSSPSAVAAQIPQNNPGGSTAMDEGLYRGWDELRTVPRGQQSGLRVIVLFTDGCSNSVPAVYDAAPGRATGLRTYDFPKRPNDNNQTWDNPQINGLYDTQSGTRNPSYTLTSTRWDSTETLPQIPFLPASNSSSHAYHRSSGIPTSFPFYDATLPAQRALRNVAAGRYPADVWNINNAARNLLEIIASRIQTDSSGDFPIRIYSIGMGALVRMQLGTRPELSEDMLKRISNDRTSTDFNSSYTEGKYFYAASSADVDAAFQALRSQITRLSR